MPIKDIPIELIDSNPYNSRIMSQRDDIEALSKSLSLKGLLSPIMVKPSNGRFQIIFGHRRVGAARLLGWKSIRAECVNSISDEDMLQLSLLENFARKDLSSYETALCFQRMISEFGKTHEEIARGFGCSRSYVSNHLRMLNLVDREVVMKDEILYSRLRSISEHHARLLLQVEKQEDRMELFKLVSEQNLSVRELHRIIHGLRGWFANSNDATTLDPGRRRGDLRPSGTNLAQEVTIDSYGREISSHSRANDLFEIQKTLAAEFELPHSSDFESFSTLHAFDDDFSIFSEFPPFNRFEGERGFEKVKNWFFRIAPSWTVKIEDVRVRFFENIALATLYVSYRRHPSSKRGIRARGTVVFIRKESGWKIVHEHWSQLKQYRGFER